MKGTITVALCLSLALPATANDRRPDPAMLNSKHHRLRIQVGSNGDQLRLDAETVDELTRFAVGADVEVRIPSTLGTGHGPFKDVYANEPPKARAISGLTVTAFSSQTFVVRCMRAGVFELVVEVVGVDGKPMKDAVDIGCIAPTRFTATLLPGGSTRYLAGASEVLARLTWFGRRANGDEVPLLGAVEVKLPEGSPVAIGSSSNDEILRLHALHPATSPTIISTGQTVALPIEIVEPKAWKLDVSLTTKSRIAYLVVRAFDDLGRPLAGLGGCAISSFSGGVETPRGKGCSMIFPERKKLEWNADRICATVRGKQACAVP